MSFHSALIEELPYVNAKMTYLAPMSEKPRRYNYDPPPGVPVSNAVFEDHTVAIRDLRAVAPQLSLDEQGFAFRTLRSNVRDFYNDDEVRQIYYQEIELLVAQATGAHRVLVFDHTVRRRISGQQDRGGGPRQPVPRAHNDYTLKSGPQRVRDLAPDEAEQLLKGRFAVVNAWKPIRGPLQDAPLAVCDARSIADGDLIASDLLYKDRVGETYAVRYNPAHRWFYASRMLADEVLLIKSYDSAEDGRARFTPHAAFEDPTVPANILPRESIELRTLIFY